MYYYRARVKNQPSLKAFSYPNGMPCPYRSNRIITRLSSILVRNLPMVSNGGDLSLNYDFILKRQKTDTDQMVKR